MKGQATLTVKDKNGNIKSVTTKDNVVFDIPKHILQNALTYGLKYQSNIGNKLGNPLNDLVISKYFNSITVHDVPVSTTDAFDVRCPLLSGGTPTRSSTALVDYVQYDAAASSVLGNTIIRRWDWANVSKNMSIKSIAMAHENKMSESQGTRSCPIFTYLGNDYILYSDNSSRYCTIFKSDNTIDLSKNSLALSKVLDIGYFTAASNDVYGGIYALPNDEYAILRYYDDMTTNDIQQSTKYLYIVKFTATGIVVQRKWALTDFDVGYTDVVKSSIACTSYNGKNYITINNSSTNFGIYVIPDTQVAPSAALTGSTYVSNRQVFAYGNCFMQQNSSYLLQANVIELDDTVSYRSNVLNQKGSTGSDRQQSGVVNVPLLKGEFAAATNLTNYRVNTTALNFDTPIAVTAGDTLSIVYTITAT